DELVDLMGGQAAELNLTGKPAVILMAGLQGSGKTTHTGKLAQFLKNKRGRQVMVVACDVYRPAAIDQLEVVAKQVGVEIYTDRENKNPVEIAKNAIRTAQNKGINTVIVDTAGR